MPPLTTTTYPGTSPYSTIWGYSRAVRRGPFIHVSGTTSVSPDPPHPILHPDSAYDQTLVIFNEILKAVDSLGGKKEDIVRVRMYVRNEEDSDEVGRGMRDSMLVEEVMEGQGEGEVMRSQIGGWAATMMVGCRMVHSDIRVEIEAEAVVGE